MDSLWTFWSWTNMTYSRLILYELWANKPTSLLFKCVFSLGICKEGEKGTWTQCTYLCLCVYILVLVYGEVLIKKKNLAKKIHVDAWCCYRIDPEVNVFINASHLLPITDTQQGSRQWKDLRANILIKLSQLFILKKKNKKQKEKV